MTKEKGNRNRWEKKSFCFYNVEEGERTPLRLREKVEERKKSKVGTICGPGPLDIFSSRRVVKKRNGQGTGRIGT